jgi:hypothetical protein
MKPKTACALLLVLSGAANAWAGDPGSIYVRGSVGYAAQSLRDLNDDISLEAATWRPVSTSLDWEEFGGAVPFGLEGGFQFSDRLSGGIGFTYQKGKVEHFAALDFFDSGSGVSYLGDLNEDQDLTLLDFYGALTVWIPQAPGLHFGGQLGIARGKLEIADGVDVSGDDGSFLTAVGNGDADGTGISAGIYAGYEVALSPMFGLSGRAGYLYCNVGELEGTYTIVGDSDTGPIDSSTSGPVTDFNGGRMDFDFSGLRASAAVTLRFGGPTGY